MHSGPVSADRLTRCGDRRPRRPVTSVYSPLPFFHSSSLFTGWASAITAGIPIATRRRFSASGTLPDVRRFGATMLTYTGKVLNYILATPRGARRRRQPAPAGDRQRGVAPGHQGVRPPLRVRGAGQLRVHRGHHHHPARSHRCPAGRLGSAESSVKVLDAETGEECPPVALGADGRPTNLEEAIGEIVETRPTSGFEGYYKNEEATSSRFRDGWYWSGDLAFRDADGWLYFAGRSNEWLRVDGENFAAAPVEAIVAAPSRRPLRCRVRGARRARRRPGHGRTRAGLRRDLRPRRLRRLPRPAAGPRHEVAPGVRAGDRRASQARQHEGRQATAPSQMPGAPTRSTGVPAGAKRCAR